MRKIAVVALAPLLMAGECTPPRYMGPPIDLKLTDSRLHRPTFAPSIDGASGAPVGEFAVSACRPEKLLTPVWQIERKEPGGEPDGKLTITYGEVPDGYREVKAPEPLVPGRCYVALASEPGTGFREFRLRDDGRVVTGAGGRVRGGRNGHQIERAAVACIRAYRRARTPEQALAVDAARQAVADTAVTCREVRDGWPDAYVNAESTEQRVLMAGAGIALLIGLFVLQDKLDVQDR